MKNIITVIILLIAAFAIGLWLGPRWLEHAADSNGIMKASGQARPAEREILYWVAPMDPNYRRDEPGKSPMGMDLVPVYADESGGGEGVSISPAVENSLGVRTAPARVRPLWRRIEAMPTEAVMPVR